MNDDLLSPSVVWSVEQVCDRFEVAWKAGQRPVIKKYLGDRPEPERSVLLRDLLGLELDYRRRGGEKPRREEYEQCFPEMAGELGRLFPEPDPPTAADDQPAAVS